MQPILLRSSIDRVRFDAALDIQSAMDEITGADTRDDVMVLLDEIRERFDLYEREARHTRKCPGCPKCIDA